MSIKSATIGVFQNAVVNVVRNNWEGTLDIAVIN